MQIINNRPEWFEIYLERKYQFIEPVITHALRCIEDYFWKNKEILSGGYNLTRIFKESSEHKICQGHTFPLHDYLNNLVMLSVFNQNIFLLIWKRIFQNLLVSLSNCIKKHLIATVSSLRKECFFISTRTRNC